MIAPQTIPAKGARMREQPTPAAAPATVRQSRTVAIDTLGPMGGGSMLFVVMRSAPPREDASLPQAFQCRADRLERRLDQLRLGYGHLEIRLTGVWVAHDGCHAV